MKPSALLLIAPGRLDHFFPAAARESLEHHLTLLAPPCAPASYRELGPLLREVQVIVTSWGMPAMDDAFLHALPRLEAVFYTAGSVRSFVTPASWARGIRVVSASAANAVPAAEFAFAQIILGLKQTWQQVLAGQRERRLVRDTATLAGTYGSTVGLLALGQIGQLVAARLRTLTVTTLAYDPLVSPAVAEELGVQLVGLDELFARADVVSCHLPLLAETERLLRAPHFRAMRPGAMFLNTARGGVVAESELITVLRERPDLFAVLDVTEPEPPVAGSPLYELPNVVLTPHVAGSVGRECRRLGAAIAADVVRYVRGEPLAGEVTPALFATLA